MPKVRCGISDVHGAAGGHGLVRRRILLPDDFPQIVCLCGSTRFMQVFYDVGSDLTLRGHIVLTVGVCKHPEDHGAEALGADVARRLDELHLWKIDLADIVVILNVGGYIGESTAAELNYARQCNKRIHFLEPDKEPYTSATHGV
jgi:hypothetical protein